MYQGGIIRASLRRAACPASAYVTLVGVLYISGVPAASAADTASGINTVSTLSTLSTGSKLSTGSTSLTNLRNTGSGSGSFGSILENRFLAQGTPGVTPGVTRISPVPVPSSTILPTDVLPLPQIQNRLTFAENLQLRLLQRLPARFYFTSSTEISLRYESNPFQFPTKRRFIRQLGQAFTNFQQLSPTSQQEVLHSLALPGAEQTIFRVLPNVTGGFTLTPHTRVFCNYFMIRDSLSSSTKLNTTINSIAYGMQQDIPLGNRANLQAEIQARSLFQAHQPAVFDYLPGLTLSYVLTPRTVGFVNCLLQMRGLDYFQAPTRELDPFYTWGFLHQRGGWSFSASTTFVQNFREKFKHAQIKQDNYAFISDFEIARRIFRQMPGLQAFVRAEPIWNFHSRYRPGLAGMDFRLFYGFRMALTKPSLTAGLEQLKQQIEEQEGEPGKPTAPRPSAYLMPYQVIASTQQPIHGFLQSSPATQEQPIHAFLGTTQKELAAMPPISAQPAQLTVSSDRQKHKTIAQYTGTTNEPTPAITVEHEQTKLQPSALSTEQLQAKSAVKKLRSVAARQIDEAEDEVESDSLSKEPVAAPATQSMLPADRSTPEHPLMFVHM